MATFKPSLGASARQRPAVLRLQSLVPSYIRVGYAFVQRNNAISGTAPYAYSIVDGAIPAGTAFDPTTGTVSGTPTVAGAFAYRVRVVDSTGRTASRQIGHAVALLVPAPRPPASPPPPPLPPAPGPAPGPSPGPSPSPSPDDLPSFTRFFSLTGDTLFSGCGDPGASVQLGSPDTDPRVINVGVGGVLSADAGLGFGKFLNGQGKTRIRHRTIRADLDSHNPNVKRSEFSMQKMFALGDNMWIFGVWRTPSDVEKGLGQLRYRGAGDFDGVTFLQAHDPGGFGYTGCAPYFQLAIGTSAVYPQGYRTFALSEHTWNPVTSRFSAGTRPQWVDGTAGRFTNTAVGTADPEWPQLETDWGFALHLQWHYAAGQFFTRAWRKIPNGVLKNFVNNTTTPNLPDISKSGGNSAAVGYIKGGIYATNLPNNGVDFDWRTEEETVVLLNQDAALFSTGLTEDQIAERLIDRALSGVFA